jgi:hypothetical protein
MHEPAQLLKGLLHRVVNAILMIAFFIFSVLLIHWSDYLLQKAFFA